MTSLWLSPFSPLRGALRGPVCLLDIRCRVGWTGSPAETGTEEGPRGTSKEQVGTNAWEARSLEQSCRGWRAGESVPDRRGSTCEWAALRILSAGLEGTLSDARSREDAGGGQLEGDVRADCKLVVSLLPDLQTYYIFGHHSVQELKTRKSVARVLI